MHFSDGVVRVDRASFSSPTSRAQRLVVCALRHGDDAVLRQAPREGGDRTSHFSELRRVGVGITGMVRWRNRDRRVNRGATQRWKSLILRLRILIEMGFPPDRGIRVVS